MNDVNVRPRLLPKNLPELVAVYLQVLQVGETAKAVKRWDGKEGGDERSVSPEFTECKK